MHPTCLAIFLFLLASFFFQNLEAKIILPKNVTVPALIMFGDSIVDTGNNNHLATLFKCNFPPYGKDFLGGEPTGRFSNGRIPSDILAEELGIKEFLPAYLDPNLQTEELLTGVCFASSGTGYDPLTSQVTSVLSLSDQLKLFKEYIEKLKTLVGEERTATIISQSLYVVCAGSNDFLITYFLTPLRRAKYDVPAYTDFMIQSASTFLQELYDLGARRIAVLSVPSVGCVPYARSLLGGIGGGRGGDGGCIEDVNEAAQLFNAKLSSQMDWLNNKFPEARMVYIDVYFPLLHLNRRPRDYGFEEVSKGCCGTGKIEVAELCNDLNPFTCTDVSKYVYWDSVHPTEKAYQIIFASVEMQAQSLIYKFF
ncbi:PREDICTED: GDSL esterase/lipase At5g42170-like [Nelumbo nucifera]|uniref:GDSL esterase/lipase EXL3-like n=2 Tax=Nelumbo nucifera TaxID=4432 RepID=A0A822ZL04_NELNU|nr:PREDICTED: GDSL esterase/lipase At5g42170-like [Nelumbo nucifera]DAD46754.1 TPA_asm: hypothetical protein HUJ06_016691 [Nelumbo nucifera]